MALFYDRITAADDPDAMIPEEGAPDAIKKAPSALTPAEVALARAIQKVLDTYGERAVLAVLNGEALDLTPMSAALRAAILADLTSAALSTMGDLAEIIGPEFDAAAMQTAASEWAQAYTYDLVSGLTSTTQATIQSAVSAFHETPGMTRGQVAQLLQGAFGPDRADMIATTEITRAAAAGTATYQARLKDAGLTFVRVWRTATDEGTCAICTPLNGKAEDTWTERFPDGPPAHPRCRCAVTLRAVLP
jgi:hypothetical protein